MADTDIPSLASGDEFTFVAAPGPLPNATMTSPLSDKSAQAAPSMPTSFLNAPISTSRKRPNSDDKGNSYPNQVRAVAGPSSEAIESERILRQAAEERCLKQSEELESLRSQIMTAIDDKRRLEQTNANQSEELQALSLQIEVTKNRVGHASQQEVEQERAQRKAAETRCQEQAKTLENIRQEISILEREKKSLEEKENKREVDIKDLRFQIQTLMDEKERVQAFPNRSQEEIEQEYISRQAAEAKYQEFTKTVENIKGKISALQHEKEALEEKNAEQDMNIKALRSQAEILREEKEQAQVSPKGIQDEMNAERALRLAAEDKCQAYNRQLVETRLQNATLVHEKELQEQTVDQQKREIKAMANEIRQINEKKNQERIEREELEERGRENVRVQVAFMTSENETLDKLNKELQKEILSLKQGNHACSMTLQTIIRERDEATRLSRQTRDECDELNERQEEMEVTVAIQSERLGILAQERDDALVELKRLQESAESGHTTQQLKEQEEQIAKLRAELDALRLHKEKAPSAREHNLHRPSSLPNNSPADSRLPGNRWYPDTSHDEPDDADREDEGLFASSATIQKIVDEAFQKFGAKLSQSSSTQPASTAPASPRKRKIEPKPGSDAYNKSIKHTAFGSMEAKTESQWRSAMRQIFLSRTGMHAVNAFQTYRPVADQIAEDYAKGIGAGPVGDQKYVLYFGDGWRTAKWTKQVIKNFIPDVIAKHASARIPGVCLSAPTIEACILDYVKQARVSWNRRKPRLHESGTRYETREEALARSRSQEEQRAISLRSYSRKSSVRFFVDFEPAKLILVLLKKYRERLEAVNELLKDTTLTSFTRNKWEMVQNIVVTLGNEGQSSDETDNENPDRPMVSSIPYYRRRIVSELLSELDGEWRRRQIQLARTSRKRVTTTLRPRHRGTKKSTRTLVRRLPQACYHRRFLRSLDVFERDVLDIQDLELPLLDRAAQHGSDTEPESAMETEVNVFR
ncbi:hypothetical protein VNI00_016474 [Paramarasmius palmivorus]|uniref:Uncharacterized protein n=1 Tax=Paramarasmius palmivorus TaxID=297713 RepID=A0AAW0BDN7_9AGAR